jgi:hypothetical protein
MIIGGFLAFVGAIVGHFSPQMENTMKILLWAIPLTVLITSLVIGVFLTPYFMHRDNNKNYEEEKNNVIVETSEQYLALNPDARIDKAHRVFCKLYKWGEQLKEGKAGIDQKQQWDKEVRKALNEHCNRDCIDIYLMNTGRTSPSQGITPLQDIRYESAIDHVKRLLENDFIPDIK